MGRLAGMIAELETEKRGGRLAGMIAELEPKMQPQNGGKLAKMIVELEAPQSVPSAPLPQKQNDIPETGLVDGTLGYIPLDSDLPPRYDMPTTQTVDPHPIAKPLQDAGRAIQGVMDPVFEYGVVPFLGGAISGTTRFADAAGYLADKIGVDSVRDKLLEIGDAGSKFGADLTQGTAPEDMGALGQLVRGTFGAMGSSLPSLALGLAATPAQGASWASKTAMALHGGSDALGEAGDTMREVLANGGSIEEARSAANKVAVANLLYNAIAEPLAGPFSGWGEAIPGLRGHLMRGAVRGGEEMIQETLQDMWSAAAQKRREDEQPVTYGDVLGNFLAEGKNLPAYLQESGAPAFLSSFLMGAGMPHVAAKDTQQLQQTTKEPSFTPEQRGDLLRWAHGETGRMAEEAQFAEDGTPENPLSEADLARYQEIRDAMKRRDYVALAEMRGAEESAQSAAQPEASHEDAAVGLAPEAVKAVAPRKGRYTDMDEFVAAATSPEGKRIASSMWVELDDISDAAAERILNDTGIDVSGYAHALDGSGLHHILNRHGVDGKALKTHKNQLAVVESDLKRLPEVVETPDIVEAGRTQPNGNSTLIFKKRVNGYYLVVEDVRGSLGKLIPITMWKERVKQKAGEGFSHTSETPQTPSQSPSLAESAMPPFEATLSSPERAVNRQQNKLRSLKSGPSEPEPAPASLASATPTLEPEEGGDWRYENRNPDPNLSPTPPTVKDGEQYEQQSVSPTGTVPDQAKNIRAKGSVRPRTPAEIRQLAKDVEARMIAAGRPVEEAKAMGLLASEFAGRFAERTNTRPEEALNVQFKRSKWDETKEGEGFDQIASRQSPDYDPGDPQTWPPSAERNEAIQLEAWSEFDPDGEVETWPESPEKTEALALQKEYREIEAWIDGHSVDEVLANDELNERGVAIEERLRELGRDLKKQKPKGIEKRLSQLIDAEEEAAARELGEEYYQQRPEMTENIRRGQAAMEKVIAEQTDVMDAMHRDDLGSISFLWGEPGRGDRFKGGWGVSHLIAHRNAQGYDGEAVARKMVEVVAKGALDKTDHIEKGSRAYLKHDGYTAVMSLYRDGERQTWLLTGWEDYKEKAPGEIGSVYDDLNPTLSEATRFHPEEGAGASAKSKPPRAQKSKSKTAPNARTYFLPDGTSIIEFFETANKSTSFHEFGHHIFNKMLEFSGKEGVDPQMAEDVETILKAVGVTREAFDADKKNARRRAHEFFARGFEKYLGEGKAPTKALRDVFRRIHNWMIEVYHKIANIPGKQLSDEMRAVYDRLFASDGAFGDVYGAEDVKAGTNAPGQTQEMVTTTTRKGVEVDTKVRDTSNDTRMMDLFNSPNVVAKRHAKFRPFFGMAKEAVEKQERMRSNWNKAVDAIYGRRGGGGLLKKDQVSLFNETLLEGDALGKVFTAEELRERGFDNSMARAYRLVRGLYDNAHRMLSAQRNKYGKEDMAYREGYVPHFFHAWRVLEDGKIVTSYRSMNEAVKEAEKLKKEDESRNIRVAPALNDFGGRGKLDAVTLGDMQYFKLAGNIEKAFELSADEARALLEDTARMKGRSRIFKNAWERKGIAGFEQNMEYALRHYLNLSARYIAMDTLKHDGINLFERTFGRFDNDHKGLAKYTKDYLNDVLGVPSGVEETLNTWIRNSWLGKYLPDVIGDRPATVAASSIASLVAHAKLGFLNIASAAMNITQLVETQAIIGPTWTVRGLTEYLHPNMATKRLYVEAGIEENITAENPSGYSKTHQARGLLAETSMAAFRTVDGMVRKVTLIGAYRKALSEGKNRAEAMEYAKKVNDDVNFDYSVADAPNFIRRTGPIGTVLFQFKKFPIKLMELALPGVGKLKGMEQVRFWAPMLALSGLFGVPGFDWLKDWIKSLFGKDIELEVKKLVAESPLPEPVKRTVLYGALSNVGIDVGRRAGMGDFFPSELKDLTGPAAATIARMVESLPKVFDDGNFMDLIEGVSPGLANPIKAFMGETRDRRRDRVAFRYETPGERIARATGARPIREAIENDAVRIARYDQQKRSAAEADAIDDFLRVVNEPGTPKYEKARRRLAELRITPDRVRAEGMRRRGANGGESTAYERAMRGARTPRRYEDYTAMQNYAGMWN